MALRKAKRSPELKKLEAAKSLLVKVEDAGSEGKDEDMYFVSYPNNPEDLSNFDDGEVVAVFTFDHFVRVKRDARLELVGSELE